ncbi:unnamed protein product [Rotaria socialis]|uniref:Uncharacterized protein n=1 Tax=Rotaria socialis TaxID=392032 RepID=A0A817WE76_9BILA|nr:unnamed protein product [Rotaria socialis]CAF3683097.1 unnamed protein product [Rotaria socialis]
MANPMNRRRCHPNRRTKPVTTIADAENPVSASQEIFDQCEKLKQKILSSPNGKIEIWTYRQELLDQYEQLILCDLDYAIEKKIEHDLWTIIFKNEISYKQEQLKENSQNPMKRAEIQTSLQNFYEYASGYYMKLLQDVVHSYNFENSICKLTFPLLQKRNQYSTQNRSCKEASMLYFIQHILVHVGDLNRYSNHIDLAKTFYQYAIHTIPCLGQPYNQIAILHEMKNPSSLLTPGQNQLITAYYYIRSIAIKVTFPLAISNLEKLFQRLKDIPITRYEQQQNDFLTLFLQIIAMINLEANLDDIQSFINLFRTIIIKNFNQLNFIQMITIIMFTLHRTLDLLPRSSSSKKPELQFDITLQLFIMIIEQCLEAMQLPLSMMIIDEQHILPILYLSFAYLSNIQKFKTELFEHHVFKQKPSMWHSLAKLLRSFGVYASSLDVSKGKNETSGSLFFKYSDYPLVEERALECYTPLNDIIKSYSFKKYGEDDDETINEHVSEKDVRQLRKLRLVSIVRNLCQKNDDKTKKKIFDHLITYAKDEIVCFESSSPLIQQIPSSNFGVPGDRRITQKPTTDEQKPYNPSGANVKTPRGARNVALRQFLEPALAACESASTTRSLNQKNTSNETSSFPPPPPAPPPPLTEPFIGDSDAWPRLPSSCDSKDLFQQQSFDYESRPDSVWSNTDDSKDQYAFQSQTLATPAQQILAPGLMFSQPLSKHNPKQ